MNPSAMENWREPDAAVSGLRHLARGDFVDVFLDNLVNWDFVARNLDLADAAGGEAQGA